MSLISRVLAVGSQLVNVVLFRGHQNESLSSRAYRQNHAAAVRFIDRIFAPFEKEHCRISHENDRAWARELIKDDPK
ncbi:hypothetical protein [Methyloversatilis sp. XJ19-49]|uniref:hypothetical protein n=1 Tax=Methyloversatilis sp. XJ19-49 TaxID=2963429 RepID=UPI00211C5BA8|nr:hypothetical protein [Methyloversatilis sp. XJ19-49]MCQ9378809.1 hypothetical protein [Methyloversatilis sp. XJ19-49]